MAVNINLTRRRVMEPHEQVGYRTLPRATSTNNKCSLTSREEKGGSVQHDMTWSRRIRK